jgi:stringent starvation protein B
MENDFIHFNARFGGVAREIVVPVENVIAIYARENGQGMAFEVTKLTGDGAAGAQPSDSTESADAPTLSSIPPSQPKPGTQPHGTAPEDNPEPPKKGGRPTLTRIK